VCGIAGAVALRGPLAPEIIAAIGPMTESLAHRGPDGDGFRVSTSAALGHRRLAIIDRHGGIQPMPNEDRSCWVVFNGEIYNHQHLRRELEGRGHVFKTQCDTEAIVHAYEEFGVECVRKLEGMFAFAVYDERRKELFLARDRLGKKPLFYAEFGGALHFASEIKALRRSPAWDGEMDSSGLESFLCLGHIPAPQSIYRRVKKLEPGHWLRLKGGGVEVRSYWDIEEFDTDHREPSRILEQLNEVLGSAVRQRMESEVPLGAFLSGGIDSGLVVSYMFDELGAGIATATVGFGNETHNEIPAAALVAQRYKTRHETQIIHPDLDEVFDSILMAVDEPFADDSAIPTYYVSKMARRHVTVALTGDGGDESFGGYDFRYTPHAWESRVRAFLPGRAGRSLAAWLGSRWSRSTRVPRALRWGSVLENLSHDAEGAYYLDLCFVTPADARELLGTGGSRDPRQSSVYEQVTAPYRRCPSTSPLQKAQYADLKIYLPNMPLVKVDRMSMAHGLEIRSPLLDRRVAEFAFRIPTSGKLPGLEAKHLLRRVAENRLPDRLMRLPKQGFSTPIGDWIRGDLSARYRDEVLAPAARVAAWMDMDVLRRHFDEHVKGRRDRSSSLWSAWVLERWCRLFQG